MWMMMSSLKQALFSHDSCISDLNADDLDLMSCMNAAFVGLSCSDEIQLEMQMATTGKDVVVLPSQCRVRSVKLAAKGTTRMSAGNAMLKSELQMRVPIVNRFAQKCLTKKIACCDTDWIEAQHVQGVGECTIAEGFRKDMAKLTLKCNGRLSSTDEAVAALLSPHTVDMRLVAWSTTPALVGCEPTSENHRSVTPRFVALVLLILKLRLSLPSLPRAMRKITKTTLGFGLPLGWPFR